MKTYRGMFVLGAPFPQVAPLNPKEVKASFDEICQRLKAGVEVALVRGTVAGFHSFLPDRESGEEAYHTLPGAAEFPECRKVFLQNPRNIELMAAQRGDDGTWRVLAANVVISLEAK